MRFLRALTRVTVLSLFTALFLYGIHLGYRAHYQDGQRDAFAAGYTACMVQHRRT